MNCKKISVIVPVYNKRDYVLRCIESIINQTYENLEIIVVDDGSTDDSFTICNAIVDKRLKLYKKLNSGVSSARNFGMAKATGDIISFVDADDYLDKNFFSLLANKFKEDTDILFTGFYNVVNGKFIKIYEPNLKLLETQPNNPAFFIINKERFSNKSGDIISPRIFGSVCRCLFRKGFLIDNNLFFDEKRHIAEDYFFLLKALLLVKAIIVDCNFLYYYVNHENSLTTSEAYSESHNYLVYKDYQTTTDIISQANLCNKEKRLLNKDARLNCLFYLVFYEKKFLSKIDFCSKMKSISKNKPFNLLFRISDSFYFLRSYKNIKKFLVLILIEFKFWSLFYNI